MDFDYAKERKVLRGPFLLFDGSFEVEVLDYEHDDASLVASASLILAPLTNLDSALLRFKYKADNKVLDLGRQHPHVPPLHVHFNQTETFKILQGEMALAIGYDQKEIILRPDNTPFDILPMVPHTPYPRTGHSGNGQDTVAILRAHPQDVDGILDALFFEHLFRYLDECWQAGNKMPDLVQMMVSQHPTGSAVVMLPGVSLLGPLRWWIPWKLQALIAGIGGLFGYTPLIGKYLKDN